MPSLVLSGWTVPGCRGDFENANMHAMQSGSLSERRKGTHKDTGAKKIYEVFATLNHCRSDRIATADTFCGAYKHIAENS
jgi:hypothetical protein